MKIRDIKLLNFRNYDELFLEFSDNINIIIGNNGEGKTNILESVYVLSLTKSNRYGIDNDLIQFGKKFFKLEGSIVYDDLVKKLAVSLNNAKKSVSINGKEIYKISDYVANFCVVSFSSLDLEIIKGAPSIRRNFLNISLSQMYANYITNLNEYNAILKLRNDYLKKLNINGMLDKRYLDVINTKLVEKACKVTSRRIAYLNDINALIEGIFYKLTGIHSLMILFENSVLNGDYEEDKYKESFYSRLQKNYNQELLLGNTLQGPHRDDYKFILNGNDMKLFASQGQQRLAVIAFKLAEVYVFKKYKNDYPVLLLDDIFSEIDTKKRNKIIKYLNNDIQTIITTTDILNVDETLLKNARILTLKNKKITIKGGKKNGRRKSN